MHNRRLIGIGVIVFAIGPTALLGAEDDLGKKIVQYCEKQRKEKVGDGQCSDLASQALRQAGAKPSSGEDPGPGDYVWGKLILTAEAGKNGLKTDGKSEDIEPGDVIQYRDVVFKSKTLITRAKQHTAVVVKVGDKGRELTVLEQNAAGKKYVTEMTYRLKELKEGWIRVYRPVPADENKD